MKKNIKKAQPGAALRNLPAGAASGQYMKKGGKITKKAQNGADTLKAVAVKRTPKSVYGGPEVRAKAAARRDSIRAANEAFSRRRAAGQGITDMDKYWKGVAKEKRKPDADRYEGQLNKTNASGEVVKEGSKNPFAGKGCTGSKCAKEARQAVQSGALKTKNGGKIKKKR